MSQLFGFNYRVANFNWVFETYIDKKRKQFKILCQKTCTIWHGLQVHTTKSTLKNFVIPNLITFTNAKLQYKSHIQNSKSKPRFKVYKFLHPTDIRSTLPARKQGLVHISVFVYYYGKNVQKVFTIATRKYKASAFLMGICS